MTHTHLFNSLITLGALDDIDFNLFQNLGEVGEIIGLSEFWKTDTIEISGLLSIDAAHSIEVGGFTLTIGLDGFQNFTIPFTVELPLIPVELLLAALCYRAGVINADEALQTYGLKTIADALHAIKKQTIELKDFSIEIGPLPAFLSFPESWLEQGEYKKDSNGVVVGVKRVEDAPPVKVKLGDATFKVGATGIDFSLNAGSDTLSLPPIFIAGSDLALELHDLVLKMEDGPLPDKLALLGAEKGFDTTWRGVFAKKIILWNLDRVFPGGPKGKVEEGNGARITASYMAIDSRGLTGDLSWSQNVSGSERISLQSVTLGFDRDWYPSVISAEGRVRLTDLGGASNLHYKAQLEIADPFTDRDKRWRLLLNAEGVTPGDSITVFESPTPALVAAVAGVAAIFGENDSGLVLAALAAGQSAKLLKWKRIEIHAAQIEGTRTDSGHFAFSGWLTITGVFEIKVKNESYLLSLKIGQFDVAYDPGEQKLTSDWNLDEGFTLTLPLQLEVGGSVTLNQLSLRKRDEDTLLFELGVDIDGAGDVAIGGMPNVLTLVYTHSSNKFTFEISRDGQAITLLIPEVLYASGTLVSSKNSFPSLGGRLSWGASLRASLTAYLVGTGGATDPSDYLEKDYYLFALDIGLLTATRSDGLKAVVLSGDLSFKPGIPIGATGAALYGIGVTYGQNAVPDAGDDNDYTGWYLTKDPAFSTHAKKWIPAGGIWGFGASISIGSQADEGRSWNAAAGLFLQLPGPVIVIAGKGNLFKPPVKLPQNGQGKKITAPFSAALALDFLHDRFSAEMIADLEIKRKNVEVLTLNMPARIDASLKPPLDMELSIGRFDPKSERVGGTAIGLIDITAYLMATTRGIENFPDKNHKLEPFALAFGGSGGLTAGFSSTLAELALSVEAGFDLGVSLADPPMMVGQVYVNGQLYVRLVFISSSIDITTKLLVVAPDPFELSGTVAINISLPWPLPDINFEGSFSIGNKAEWPLDYPVASNPISEISLFPRPNGTSLLETGESFDGKVLSETELLSGVPVDTGILLAFRAPVGNERPLIGKIQTQADDQGSPVWEIATTSINESDQTVRYGWRHVLTKVIIKEKGNEIAANAGWGFKAVSGNSDASTKEAPGHQASRTTLAILAPLDAPVERRFGMGAEVLSESINGWNPCEEIPNSKMGLVTFSIPSPDELGVETQDIISSLLLGIGGSVIDRHGPFDNVNWGSGNHGFFGSENLGSHNSSRSDNRFTVIPGSKTSIIPRKTRGTLIRHGLFEGPDVHVYFSSPPVGSSFMMGKHTVLDPGLYSHTKKITNLLKKSHDLRNPLKTQKFSIGLPTAIFSKIEDATSVVKNAFLLKPPCGELFLDFPESDKDKSVFIAIRNQLNLDVHLSLIDMLTLKNLSTTNSHTVETFEVSPVEVWCLYTFNIRKGTKLRMFASQTKDLPAGIFGPYGAVFLGAVLYEELGEKVASIERKKLASSQLITQLGEQATNWTNGVKDGLLKPSTSYTVEIEVQSRKTRQIGNNAIEYENNFIPFKKTISFETETDINQHLTPWLPPPQWVKKEIEQNWNIKTLPGDDMFHYREEPIEVKFADSLVEGRIATHNRTITLQLTHVSGRTPEITATKLFKEEKKNISKLQDQVSGYINNQPCTNHRDPLWVKIRREYKTLLEPGEYIAKLMAEDKGHSREAKVLHEWRFRASRWNSLQDHIASYRASSVPCPGLAADHLLAARQRIGTPGKVHHDNMLLDSLLIEDFRKAPAVPSNTPIVSVWVHQDGIAGLMLDGPEALSFTQLTLTPAQRRKVSLLGIVNDVEGSRSFILPNSLLQPGLFVLGVVKNGVTNNIMLNIPSFEMLTKEIV